MDNSLKSLEYDSTESYADYTAQQNHSSDILEKKNVAFSVCPKTKNFRKFKRKRLMPLAIEIPT